MHEIRWHGRGGQGAVTSSKILAAAAYRSGFAGVTAAPTFGAERRGAPITASTRFDNAPIRMYSQVVEPSVVVVLDESLLRVANATAGLRPNGVVIVNTARSKGELGLPEGVRVVAADVTGAAEAVGLIVGGEPMVNTAILGSIAKATGLISMESIREAISDAFSGAAAAKNIEAAQIAYDRTEGGELP
ncbi:2-oxoacid:acceptor oxidoreductase family protein [Geomonas sp. RF6]|uniref:2-oxoacid:acceptor oxidoreductase family protein n=1 Tax=Geomonas sp. RF6 TaxID=2897342 RepID=UPI001E3DA233|nr:2-oxoacid:acceptor oxidoreductase family protein [Geomonas sp. RF6]UFS72089.1 2-oxoacid:acceptor oxidoreductase family protein [Geomonas sp. RF6]